MNLVLMPQTHSAVCKAKAVRNAINARAKVLQVSDSLRHQAVAKAMTMMKLGSSPAWSVAEACRFLVGREGA